VAFRRFHVFTCFKLGKPGIRFFQAYVQAGGLVFVPRSDAILPECFTLLLPARRLAMASSITQCELRWRASARRLMRFRVSSSILIATGRMDVAVMARSSGYVQVLP